jgi:hypothetical protein
MFFFLLSCQHGKQSTKMLENDSGTGWTSLFNGKDLSGWKVKISGYELGDNYAETFSVKDGVIRVSYANYDTFTTQYGHLFYSKKYAHYKLKLEYRFIGNQAPGGQEWAYRNSGIMFHAQSPESMGIDQAFPVCLEDQFLGGDGENPRPTCNLCTPGTHVEYNGKLEEQHCIESDSKTYHGDDWVAVELVVYGDSLVYHIVEQDTVISYSKPVIGGVFKPADYPDQEGSPVKEGYIALQAESHPVEFRNIYLLDLGPN